MSGDDTDEGVTCWGFNGKAYNKQQRCPGSGTCCGLDAECMPNRLCKSKALGENIFVRGPCAFSPYSTDRCSAICAYREFDRGDYLFPRAELCADGSYCCDNDNGCCEGGRGVFLNEEGDIITRASSASQSSSAATPSRPGPTTISSAGQSTPSPSEAGTGWDGAESVDDTMAFKIGLGVGIPAAVILGALAVWFFIRRKRNKTRAVHDDRDDTIQSEPKQDSAWASYAAPASELDAPASELDDTSRRPPPRELYGH